MTETADGELQLCLSTDEYNYLPHSIKNKLTNLVDSKLQDIGKLRKTFLKKFIEKEQNSLEEDSITRERRYSTQGFHKDLDKEIEEIRKITEKLTSEKYELLGKLEVAESEGISSKYQIERYETEKTNLRSQVEYLQTELHKMNSEVLSSKQQYNVDSMHVRIELDEQKNQNVLLRQQLESMNVKYEGLENNYEDCVKRMAESQQIQNQLERVFHEELSAQKRLSDTLQSSSDNFQQVNQQLSNKLGDSQNRFNNLLQKYSQFEHDSVTEIQNLRQNIQNKDFEIEELNEKLNTANNLSAKISISDEELSMLCPNAYASQNMLKSSKNLTEIYTEYSNINEALVRERSENIRLSESVSILMQEAEDKAMQYREIKEHNSRLLQSMNETQSNMENYFQQLQRVKANGDKMTQKNDKLKAECGQLKHQNNDLSLQVQILLKQIHELRGGEVVNDIDDTEPVRDNPVEQIIAGNLVKFRTIEELQTRNLQLLSIVRYMSQEQGETDKYEEMLNESRLRIEELTKSNEELSSLRVRDSDLLDVISKQRDLYHSMLSKSESVQNMNFSVHSVNESVKNTCLSIHSISEIDASNTCNEDRDETARDQYEEIKQRFEQYKENQSENEKILQEEIDRLRNINMDLKQSNGELSSKLEFHIMRFATIENDIKLYQADIDVLRRQYEDKRTQNVLLEEKIGKLNQDISDVRKQFNEGKLAAISLNNEKDRLISENNRLLSENCAFRSQQRAFSSIANDILHIKSAVERNDSDDRMVVEKRVQDLSFALIDSKNLLSKIERENSAEKTNLLTRTEELENQLARVRKDLEEARSSIITYQTEIAALRIRFGTEQEIGDIEAEMREEKLNMTKEIKLLRVELDGTKSQLNSAQNSVREFSSLANQYETALQEQTGICREIEQNYTLKVNSLQIALKKAEDELTVVSTNLSNAETENVANLQKLEESKAQMESVREEYSQISRLKEGFKVREVEMVDLLRTRDEIICQRQERYQDEVKRHAERISEVEELKKEAEVTTAMSADLLLQYNSVREELSSVNRRIGVERDRLMRSAADMEERNKELTEINGSLLLQLEEVVSLSGKGGSPECEDSVLSDSRFSPEKLMQVIGFLRKKKDLISAQYELLLAENNRNMTNLSIAHKEIELAHRRIGELKSTIEINSQRVSEFFRVKKELEDLHEVLKQNRTLVSENKSLEDAVQNKLSENERLRRITEEKEMLVSQILARLEALKTTNSQIVAENARWRTRVSHLVNENEDLEQNRLKEKISQCELLESEVESLRRCLLDVKDENADLAEQKQTLSLRVGELVESSTSQTAAIEDLNTTNATLSEHVAKLRKLGRDYRDKYEKLRNESETENVEKRIADAVTECEEKAFKMVESMNNQNSLLREEINLLKNTAKILEEKQSQLLALLEDKQCRINILELSVNRHAVSNRTPMIEGVPAPQAVPMVEDTDLPEKRTVEVDKNDDDNSAPSKRPKTVPVFDEPREEDELDYEPSEGELPCCEEVIVFDSVWDNDQNEAEPPAEKLVDPPKEVLVIDCADVESIKTEDVRMLVDQSDKPPLKKERPLRMNPHDWRKERGRFPRLKRF